MSKEVDRSSSGLGRRSAIAAAAAGLGTFALSACTSKSEKQAASASGKKGTLVWATHVYYNQPALVGISVGFRDFLEPMGWSFKVTAAKTSGDVQQTIQAQQQALALKPDAIIATMTDPTSFNTSLKAIKDTGIYLGLNNTQPDNGNPFGAPYVGQSFFNAGRAAVTKVLDAAKAKGHRDGTVLLGYCCGNQGAVGTRTAGQKQGLKEYNSANGTNFTLEELLDVSDSDPSRAAGSWQSKLSAVDSKLVGIVCDQVGDPSIQGAKKLGKKAGWVPIVTFDVTDDRLNELQEGWFIGVVDQQPYAQGYVSAAQAWMQVTSQTVPTAVYDTGSTIVTADTLANARKNIKYINERASQLGIKV
jgi:simple sugar transport system substrate-binding protein